MDCREVVAKYAEYEQGTADGQIDGEILDHFETCPGCRTHATRIDQLGPILSHLPTVEPPEPGWPVTADRIQGNARRRRFINRARNPADRYVRGILVRPAFSICLAMVILAFGVWFSYVNYLSSQYPLSVVVPDQDPGGYVAVHVGMSAQEPLAQKGGWALAAAVAAKGVAAETVPTPRPGGG